MFDRQHHKIRKVSLTPMIDMVFLLLIFSMVTTNFNKQTAISLEFNSSSNNESISKEPNIIMVTARNDQKIGIGNRSYSPRRFRNFLQKTIAKKQGDYIIALQADPKATVQNMIEAIDNIHLSGASNITIVGKTGSRN